MAVVLDLDGSSEIDKFHGERFALSPDKQLLMYVKSYPRMAFGASNEYLVYDLTAAPQVNRVSGEVVAEKTESVGIPVFPTDSLNVPGDNLGVPRTLVHSWGSPGFFWLGNENVVAFGDYNQGALSLVVIDMRRGVRNRIVRLQPVNGPSLFDSALVCRKFQQEGYELRLWDIAPSQNSPEDVSVEIRSADERCGRFDIFVPGLHLTH
jgi:hypothetical protein